MIIADHDMHLVACTRLEELILWVACVFEERFIYTLHIMGAGRAWLNG